MSDRRPTFEELNAYVDRELAAEDAARVAAAVARDRGLADQVAALSRLKAAVGAPVDDMPAIRLGAPRRQRWIAAAAVLALLLAGAGFLVVGEYTRAPKHWLDAAWTAHRHWADSRASEAPLRAGVVLATLSRLGPEAHVPDLSAARLSVARIRHVARGTAGKALHVGYVGTRGCRVSLWIVRGGEASDVLTRHERSGLVSFSWRAGELDYGLMASGMSPQRFELIARAAYRATRARLRPGPEMRTALRESRRTSPPCAG